MATPGPRGPPPLPSSGRLDEALGSGPSLPWCVLLVGCLHRAYVESESRATFSTADRSRAAFSTAYRSSPPPCCHIDEAGGSGEEFPLVPHSGTNPVVPRRDASACIDEPGSLSDQEGTCLHIWEADGNADGSRRSYPADQRRDAWGHMHGAGGLTADDDDDGDHLTLRDDDGYDSACIPTTRSAFAPSSQVILTEATEAGTGRALSESVAEKCNRPPPVLRGSMGGLPQELVIRIAREVLKSSLKDVIAMKLTCNSWNKAFEISGPLLVVTRQDPSSPSSSAVSFFKIASQKDELSPLVLLPVDTLYPPLVRTRCWGSSRGLIALKLVTDNSLSLHCLTCGFTRPLPRLPLNYEPKGIFMHSEDFIISLMMDVAVQSVNEGVVILDTTLMFLQQLQIDAGDVRDEEIWFWDVYPGTHKFTPVRTVNFMRNATFSAATALSLFILDRTDRLLNQPFVTIELEERLALNDWTATWMHQGHHIFVCGQSAYLCILTRSIFDTSDIGIMCFEIEQNAGSEVSLV